MPSSIVHDSEQSPASLSLSAKLKATLHAAWGRPFYRRHWREQCGIERVEQVVDRLEAGHFETLPVVRKSHLREHQDELVELEGAREIFSSSGTTGRPIDMPIFAAEEVEQVLRVRRLMRELGVKPGSRVLHLLSLNDLFSAGPLAWQAAKAEGGCAIRCTTQRTGRLRLVLDHLRPDVVVGNPLALVRLAEEASDWWPSPEDLPSHAFLVGAATFNAELQPTPLAHKVAQLWGLTTWLNSYGASDVGPVAYECRHHNGMHLHDDMQLVELVDPRTHRPITDPEQPGEVVVTGLTLPRGFVPVRYATGDMAAWLRQGPCPCGRTTPRLGPIIGRINQHLKVVGQTVFPEFLIDVADRCVGVQRSAVRVERGDLDNDEVTVLVLPTPGHDPGLARRRVQDELGRNLATAPAVRLTTEAELAALEDKASLHSNMVKIPRFFDFRGGQPTALL